MEGALDNSSSYFSQMHGNMVWVRSANGINGAVGNRSLYLFKRVALKGISSSSVRLRLTVWFLSVQNGLQGTPFFARSSLALKRLGISGTGRQSIFTVGVIVCPIAVMRLGL